MNIIESLGTFRVHAGWLARTGTRGQRAGGERGNRGAAHCVAGRAASRARASRPPAVGRAVVYIVSTRAHPNFKITNQIPSSNPLCQSKRTLLNSAVINR